MMWCKKRTILIIIFILLIQFGLCFSIELISETAVDGFEAKFIRVEHNTAMLFEPDTSIDTLTVSIINCSDPYYPGLIGEFRLPSSISGYYMEFHPIDTNDSLLVILNDTSTIDFYSHLGDTLVLLRRFTEPWVRYFTNYAQLYDSFLVVFREYQYLNIYNVSTLTHIYLLESISSGPLTAVFDAEYGLLCTGNGCQTCVYSLGADRFLDLIDCFGCASDYYFQYLDIDGRFIFAEGRANAYVYNDTLVAYEWWDPGEHEDFGAPFEIWEHYIIKAGSDRSPDRPMTIAEITAWYPHPIWTWFDTLKGEIFEIEDTLLYTFMQDTLRIYNLNSLLGIEERSLKPKEFAISVYPNPFNSSTTLRFTLDQSTAIEATIYNLLGEKVSELVNDKLPSGVHTVQWEAGNCPSGIYFCRLKAGEHKEVKRMLLMR
ncbi:T9SS type A sorting domain-containing protein [bacterium]|nr:T9SS type A sorting domain-containing protein [bacterium]